MKKTRKRGAIDRLFEMNKIVVMCIFFTINTAINVVSGAIANETIYLSLGSMAWTFALISAPVLPFAILQRLWKSEFIGERDYLLWTSAFLHYVVSCGLILLFTFIRGLFEPLPQGFYFTRIAEYTFVYIIISGFAIIADLMNTAKLNENLRKIQKSEDVIRRSSL